MLEIKQTDVFRTWMRKLRDIRANTVIVKRIERLSLGNFGDHIGGDKSTQKADIQKAKEITSSNGGRK